MLIPFLIHSSQYGCGNGRLLWRCQFFSGDNYPTGKTFSQLFFYIQSAYSLGKDFSINHFLDQRQANKFFVLLPLGGKLAGGKIVHLDR